MRNQRLAILSFLVLLFIAFGDRMLPEPLGRVSYRTRTTINRFLVGNFQLQEPIDPHERTEEALQEIEKKSK